MADELTLESGIDRSDRTPWTYAAQVRHTQSMTSGVVHTRAYGSTATLKHTLHPTTVTGARVVSEHGTRFLTGDLVGLYAREVGF